MAVHSFPSRLDGAPAERWPAADTPSATYMAVVRIERDLERLTLLADGLEVTTITVEDELGVVRRSVRHMYVLAIAGMCAAFVAGVALALAVHP